MKAQIWSFDFAVSLVIFASVFIILVLFWSHSNDQAFAQVRLDEMQDRSIYVSDLLVRSPGSPENWTAGSVTLVGLASSEKVLDEGKVYQFTQMDYDSAKSVMDIGQYEFYFSLEYTNSSVVMVNEIEAVAGTYPSDAYVTVPIERHVLLDGSIVRMKLYIWSRQL